MLLFYCRYYSFYARLLYGCVFSAFCISILSLYFVCRRYSCQLLENCEVESEPAKKVVAVSPCARIARCALMAGCRFVEYQKYTRIFGTSAQIARCACLVESDDVAIAAYCLQSVPGIKKQYVWRVVW